MNEDLNLVEILKDCPKGTKLYSPLFGEVEFEQILKNWGYVSVRKGKDTWPFESDARFPISDSKSEELMLFPSKEQRDWSKFAYKLEPKFKVGNWYQCTKSFYGKGVIFTKNTAYYCAQKGCLQDEYGCHIAIVKDLYDNFKLWTIQDAKDGDVIFYDEGWICIFKCIHGIWYSSYCFVTDDGEFHTGYERHAIDSTIHGNAHPATKEQRDILMKAMNDAGYKWNTETKTLGKLIESKFDPKTLQPFDKVLVRDKDLVRWRCTFYSHLIEDNETVYKYVTAYNIYRYCIPYNDDTKHLVGTTEEAPEFYRYWED